ncbi:unnamed protein product [Dibothriocephalus latus]|uniref:Innexin n=1 Tax=Dibothriocephalus latus TaxID=60516 RepID=A0A3P6PER8_DIBLA|nr:unnamed protein product [Dibothriocephalus latus]
MLGTAFIDSYQKYQAVALVGIQDWADRLSFSHSTVILIICTAIVSAKTYILKPLACHVPTVPTGSNFKDYMASYCWVHGTVPIGINETIPEDEAGWDALELERKMAYYQWVPFVLGLQTILFYIPHVIWQNVTFNRLGTDLTAIITKAMDALKTTAPEKREEKIANVAERLELLLFAHRDYRRGKMAALGRQVSDTCSLLLASKRLGTWTVLSYLCIKLLYLANAIGQLYLMKEFLGYSESMTRFMVQLTTSLIQGSDWRESLYFPRVAFCSVKLRHLGQADNRFLGMCALAVNMLNEKIYIFLWYWTLLVAICTGVSIITWFLRLTIRRRKTKIIRKYLKLGPELEPSDCEKDLDADTLDPDDPRTVDRFVKEFLRLDGVFIVHMLNLNAGDIVTGEVIRLLWKAWLSKVSCLGLGLYNCNYPRGTIYSILAFRYTQSQCLSAYYQWVPFVLGLQTILFYIPHVIWQNVTFNRLGTDLTAIITKAMDALKTTAPEKREEKIANVAERLEMLLFAHRDDRRGKMAALGRRVNDTCSLLLASKRLGTWTVLSYLCIKMLYLANAIGQLYLMKKFLGYGDSMTGFMIALTHSLIQGSDWRESLYFPRVAFCSLKLRHLGQANNRYVGMCALAVNMLNEKIYIFLVFWTLLVAVCTGISIIVWFLRLTIRRRKTKIIRKYLKLGPELEASENEKELDADTLDPDDPRTVDRFIKEFLRLDGVFIIHMLNLNAGDIVTGEVIRLLWKAWLMKYAGRRDFSYDPWWQYSYPSTEDSQEKHELTEKPDA